MPADKVVLDVRDGVNSVIKGATVIPQSELAARMAELPKDKEILIHCNTGILAGMAVKQLKENGYQARYLKAVVQINPDGSFEVTEI